MKIVNSFWPLIIFEEKVQSFLTVYNYTFEDNNPFQTEKKNNPFQPFVPGEKDVVDAELISSEEILE